MTRADIEVVVRCKDEMPYVEETLRALRGYRVVVFDSGSKDGSREIAVKEGVRIVDVDPKAYVPGRVLDAAMRATTGAIVAFVNADAIPLVRDAVERLVSECNAGAAAAFGRQAARAASPAWIRADHDRAFPPKGAPPVAGFFSMAACAIRRDVWEKTGFDGSLRFSEDVEWTLRCRALGAKIVYVPEAEFEHAHTYGPKALYKRMRGEGAIDARLDRAGRPGLVRHFLRPLAGAVLRDLKSGVATPGSLGLRAIAQAGRFVGRGEPEVALVPPAKDGVPKGNTVERPGHAALPAPLACALERAAAVVKAEVGPEARAVALLGSLASAEPSLTFGADGRVTPRNDADMVVVVEGRAAARRLRAAAERASERASREVGFPVDVAPVAQAEIDAPRGRLLWAEAGIRGARVLAGDAHALAPLASLTASDVAVDELRRLLANRATGLALSRLDLVTGAYDAEVGARHVAKAWIAVGDVLLVRAGSACATLTARAERLAALAPIGAPVVGHIAQRYAEAVAWLGSATPTGLDGGAFDRAREELAAAYAFVAPPIERGAGPALSRDEMTDRLIPRDLPDLSPIAAAFAGLRAAARGVVAVSRAGHHPRAALAEVSAALAFAPHLEDALAFGATALAAPSPATADVRGSLLHLREVAA